MTVGQTGYICKYIYTYVPSHPKRIQVNGNKGDQIGRIFAYRAMVVFGQFSEN
jgi:uncharacterized protein YwbE